MPASPLLTPASPLSILGLPPPLILSLSKDGLDASAKPYVILMVGVNGVGKTTSIAKLAHHFTQLLAARSSSAQATPSAPPPPTSWKSLGNGWASTSSAIPRAQTQAPWPTIPTRPARPAGRTC